MCLCGTLHGAFLKAFRVLEGFRSEEERRGEGGRRENWRGEADEDEAGGGEISHGGGAVVKHWLLWSCLEMSTEAWKQVGKAMVATYALMGFAWWWDETAPLGWWTLKPRTKVWISSGNSLNQPSWFFIRSFCRCWRVIISLQGIPRARKLVRAYVFWTSQCVEVGRQFVNFLEAFIS